MRKLLLASAALAYVVAPDFAWAAGYTAPKYLDVTIPGLPNGVTSVKTAIISAQTTASAAVPQSAVGAATTGGVVGVAPTDAYAQAPATALANVAPLVTPTNVITDKPFAGGAGAMSYQTIALGIGTTCHVTFEAPDLAYGVQVAFPAASATDSYQIQEAAVEASSMYGPPSGTNNPGGVVTYDPAGNAISQPVPITFNNSGVRKDFSTGSPQAWTGSNATSGNYVIAVTTSAAVSAGATSIPVTTTYDPGGLNSQTGMYIQGYTATGVAALSAGTTISVSGSSTTNITVPSGDLTSALRSGQVLWVSVTPLVLTSPTIGPAPNSPAQTWIWSDPVMLNGSYERLDGNFQIGQSLSGSPFATGTHITSLTPTSISFSPATSSAASGSPLITVGLATQPTLAVVPTDAQDPTIHLSSVAGISPGMLAAGAGIAANVYVVRVNSSSNKVTLTSAANGVYNKNGSPDLASFLTASSMSVGETVTFTRLVYPNYGAFSSAGVSTVSVPSTNDYPLVDIRVSALGTTSSSTVPNFGFAAPYVANLTQWRNDGLRGFAYGYGATGTDDIGLWSAATAANSAIGSRCPVLMVTYLTKDRGITEAQMGDSLFATKDSPFGSESGFNVGAAEAANRSFPIGFINFGESGQNGNDLFPPLQTAIQQHLMDVFIPEGWTHNGYSSVTSYIDNIMGLAQLGLEQSPPIQTVVATETPRRAVEPGCLSIGPNAYTGTSIPVLTWFSYSASGVPLYDTAGVLAEGQTTITGTWAYNGTPNIITSSASVSLPGNDQICINEVITSGVTASTTIPLTYPMGLDNNQTWLNWTGEPNDTIYSSGGGGPGVTSLTVNTPVTIPAGPILLANYDPGYQPATQARELVRQMGERYVVFDTFKCLEDTSNPGFYLDGSQEGVHPPWPLGIDRWAACWLSVQQQLTGLIH